MGAAAAGAVVSTFTVVEPRPDPAADLAASQLLYRHERQVDLGVYQVSRQWTWGREKWTRLDR